MFIQSKFNAISVPVNRFFVLTPIAKQSPLLQPMHVEGSKQSITSVASAAAAAAISAIEEDESTRLKIEKTKISLHELITITMMGDSFINLNYFIKKKLNNCIICTLKQIKTYNNAYDFIKLLEKLLLPTIHITKASPQPS